MERALELTFEVNGISAVQYKQYREGISKKRLEAARLKAILWHGWNVGVENGERDYGGKSDLGQKFW